MHQDLVVRTVNMVRPPESSHGFGICVKGGKDSGECPELTVGKYEASGIFKYVN
jgi:hypothetical protein